MTLRENLQQIKRELTPQEPQKILNEGLDIKLGRTTRKYEEAIQRNCEYILSRSNHKVMMAIDRYNKWKLRENQDNDEDSNYGFIEII